MIFLRDYFLWPIVTLRLITRPIWKSSRNNIIFFNTIILCFCVFILALLDHFHHFVSSDDSGRASHQRTVTERLIRWQWQSISSDDSDRASLFHHWYVCKHLERIRNTNIGQIKVGQYRFYSRFGRMCYLYHKGSFHLIYVNITVAN